MTQGITPLIYDMDQNYTLYMKDIGRSKTDESWRCVLTPILSYLIK